jgi:hypothetical protein
MQARDLECARLCFSTEIGVLEETAHRRFLIGLSSVVVVSQSMLNMLFVRDDRYGCSKDYESVFRLRVAERT